MRYDNDSYREVFPKVESVDQPVIVESPVETFKPTATEQDTQTQVPPESDTPVDQKKGTLENGDPGNNQPDT